MLTIIGHVHAQNIRSYSLEVSCKTRILNSTQSILEFQWRIPPPYNQQQRVYKKNKADLGWGTNYRSLGNNDSTFYDTITTGTAFEYKFEKDSGADGFGAYAYVFSASRLPAITNRGKVLILADSLHKSFLEADIRTFRNDLTGDGWLTELKWFDSATSVNQIKAYIISRYNSAPSALKSVILLGNLAVPYSGDYSGSGSYPPPDGHTGAAPPSHEGAWPCDQYYAHMQVPYWPDSTVNNTAGARSANNNVPNDGKFDFTGYPDISLNALQLGRIDLSNMPSFSSNERSLLKQYLEKNHRFRHRIDVIRERCLVDDNIGLLNYPASYSDEHFAGNAYRNMAPLIADSVTKLSDYLSTLDTSDYLWSFGFGTGSYTNCSGIGNTTNFAASTQEVKSVFSGFFGSYFGDWDNANNFLRAPLAAKGNVLNTFYCGRPPMFFHHMGLGETIGYSMLRSQNNIDTQSFSSLLYPTGGYSQLQIHTSLLGDPTVRMQPVEPASRLFAWQDSCSQRVRMKWTASPDTAVHNYYVFRAKHIDSAFALIGNTDTLVWTDSTPYNPETVYMVRAEKLQISGSGSYYNLSQGIFDTIRFISLAANSDTSVCTNQRVRLGTVNNNHSNIVYSWIPAANTRDTFSLTVTGSGSRILIATDTAGNCALRDTFNITALALPALDTIYASGNYCNDTIGWSSSQINGGSFEYNWLFPGGSPADSSGLGLYNPGTVVYGLTGTYQTTLGVRNVSTGCIQSDTFNLLVTCGTLPIEQINLNCINSIKGKEIRFLVYDNERYVAYQIEGFDGGHWVTISRMPASSDRFYVLPLPESRQYSEIRIMGLPVNGESVILGTCAWTDEMTVWSLMPNPFQDECRISYNGINGLQDSEIKIYDARGQELPGLHFKFNDNHLELSLKYLKAGIYTFVIITGDKLFTIKAVKL